MMHHGFVDKMWWDWQKKDLTKRLTDMGGPNAQEGVGVDSQAATVINTPLWE